MFTKYNGINLPKNYSGTKFKQPLEDTQMKTHRAKTDNSMSRGVIRTSVSPSFQGALDKVVETADTVDYTAQNDDDASFYEEISDAYAQNEVAACKNTTKEESVKLECENKEPTTHDLFNELGVSHLFENIHKDDLLLIALIVLFAQEHLQNSMDAIIILALLLLYH